MSKIEKLVKEYSTKKLKEIISEQSSAYNSTFVNHAKDELIKRGEVFQLDSDIEKDVAALSDKDLKYDVEVDWRSYHLEYLEIARKEYLRRDFKNVTIDNEEEGQNNKAQTRYPTLSLISKIYFYFAFIMAVATLFALYEFSFNTLVVVPMFFVGAFIFLGLLGTSEAIKLLIDLENNSRK